MLLKRHSAFSEASTITIIMPSCPYRGDMEQGFGPTFVNGALRFVQPGRVGLKHRGYGARSMSVAESVDCAASNRASHLTCPGLFRELFSMKNRLPRRQELILFIILSLVCTVIVRITGKYDVGLAVLGAPVFLVAALMGFRRGAAPSSTPATEAATTSLPSDGPEMTP
jgi:hypothetical protein